MDLIRMTRIRRKQMPEWSWWRCLQSARQSLKIKRLERKLFGDERSGT